LWFVYDRRGLTFTLGDVAMTLSGHARPLSTHKLQVDDVKRTERAHQGRCGKKPAIRFCQAVSCRRSPAGTHEVTAHVLVIVAAVGRVIGSASQTRSQTLLQGLC